MERIVKANEVGDVVVRANHAPELSVFILDEKSVRFQDPVVLCPVHVGDHVLAAASVPDQLDEGRGVVGHCASHGSAADLPVPYGDNGRFRPGHVVEHQFVFRTADFGEKIEKRNVLFQKLPVSGCLAFGFHVPSSLQEELFRCLIKISYHFSGLM